MTTPHDKLGRRAIEAVGLAPTIAFPPPPGVRGNPRSGSPVTAVARLRARWVLAVAYGICAVFAAVYGLVITGLEPHRMWALFAFIGYLAATIVAAIGGPALVAVAVAAIGAITVPGTIALRFGFAQPEVQVVVDSATRFMAHGSPYLLHPAGVYEYNPYSPAMSLFGLPAYLDSSGDSPFADPRLWMVGVFVFCLIAALRVVDRLHPAAVTILGTVVASPTVAVAAVTSAVDLPMIGLTALGFALLSADRRGPASIAVGLALALKWTIAPILVVALVVIVHRHNIVRAGMFVAAALSTAAAFMIVPAIRNLPALIENTIAFPAGHGGMTTPAGKSIIGGALECFTGSVWPAYLVLTVIGAALMWHMTRRTTWGLCSMCTVSAAGLTALFLLAPASRQGYFAFPLVLLAVGAVHEMTGDPPPRKGVATADTSAGGPDEVAGSMRRL